MKKNLTSIAMVIALAVASLPSAFAQASPTAGTAAKPTVSSDSLNTYSKNLNLIGTAAADFWNAQEISIGGGTARSLIQAVLTGSPFQFRDFDIVLSTGRTVTAPEAQKFGENLERLGLGKLSVENLRPRPRYNPELPEAEASKYNAGFGFFVMDKNNTEYDITLFHSDKDLSLNGIMDVDCFRVVLKKGQTLSQLVQNPRLFRQAIRDPYNALSKITSGNGNPQVAKWGEVERDPGNISIRVIRSLGKFNALPMDAFTQNRIQAIFKKNPNVSSLQVSRNLLKLFQDPNWILEYEAVVKAGVFGKLYPSFAKIGFTPAQAKLNPEQRVELFLKQARTEDALQFLKILSAVEPKMVQNQFPKFIRNKNLKIGYFTGEFAPFHKGHLSVVQTALSKGGLDLIFVLPASHVTNDPKTQKFSPVEYSERISFVRAGLKNEAHAWVWPFLQDTPLEPKLEKTIAALEAFVQPSRPMTHVFGMDSFYRVLHRDLIATDPRPRIVVTRPGVPVPEVEKSQNVQVLENIQSDPISATRILHSLAVNGSSNDISPEVQEVIMKTPRYQKIMSQLLEGRTEAAANLPDTRSLKGKILIWDPRENHAGLYDAETPEYSAKQLRILTELKDLGAEDVLVFIENSAAARNSWIKERRKFYPMRVRISETYSEIPAQDRVMVLHSGVVNEQLKKGYFSQSFRGEKGLIVFETPDQPLSPLISSISGLKVIQAQKPKFSCSGAYRSAL